MQMVRDGSHGPSRSCSSASLCSVLQRARLSGPGDSGIASHEAGHSDTGPWVPAASRGLGATPSTSPAALRVSARCGQNSGGDRAARASLRRARTAKSTRWEKQCQAPHSGETGPCSPRDTRKRVHNRRETLTPSWGHSRGCSLGAGQEAGPGQRPGARGQDPRRPGSASRSPAISNWPSLCTQTPQGLEL